MSALDRVQSFLKSRAGRTALTLIPLAAAVAVSARATIIFNVSSGGGAGFNSPTLSLSTSVSPGTQALDELGGVVGIKGYGTTVGTVPGVGPTGLSLGPLGAGTSSYLNFVMNGSGTGGPFASGQTLPIMGSFTVGTNTAKLVYLRMQLWLSGPNTVYDSGVLDTAPGGATLTGHAHTSDVGGLFPSPWTFLLQTWIYDLGPGDTLSLTIPESSLDINAEPSSEVPEPGTWFLMAGGTALLLLGRRLRKR